MGDGAARRKDSGFTFVLELFLDGKWSRNGDGNGCVFSGAYNISRLDPLTLVEQDGAEDGWLDGN
jgi:hypothetical protein